MSHTRQQLLAYITNRLAPTDWAHADTIAQTALATAARTGRAPTEVACEALRQRSVAYLSRLTPSHHPTETLAPVIALPRTPLADTADAA